MNEFIERRMPVAMGLGVAEVPYFTRNTFADPDLIGAFLAMHHALEEGRDVFRERELLIAGFGALFRRHGGRPVRIEEGRQDRATFERVREREAAEAARLLLAWRAAADALDSDSSVRVHFNFEEQSPLDASLRNRVRGEGAGGDGQIIGARWSQGRWPGKGALEFRGRGQRVLFRLPGAPAALTLLAWVRVDALPQASSMLLATDEPPNVDREDSKAATPEARPLRWEVKANGQFGLNLSSGLVSGKSQWQALAAPALLTPDRHGQWLCLATVLDAARGELTHFVNGVAVARHALPAGPPPAVVHLSLGNVTTTDAEARAGVSYGFFGAVDEVVVAGRPFSPAELRRYFEVGRP